VFLYIKRDWATSLSSLSLCVHCDIIKCYGDMWSPSECWWWNQISLHTKRYGSGGLAVPKNLLISCDAIIIEAKQNDVVDVLIWLGTRGLLLGIKFMGHEADHSVLSNAEFKHKWCSPGREIFVDWMTPGDEGTLLLQNTGNHLPTFTSGTVSC
jgi:hypothetical protein